MKETTEANGNDFDLFGVLVDEKNCYGLALRHRPISNASIVSKETRFQSGEVTILRLKKADLVSAREDEFLLLGVGM